MVEASEAPVVVEEEKGGSKALPIIAVALGAGGVIAGLIIFFKKPGFGAGDKVYCVFKYLHAGPGGAFRARAVMGHTIGSPPFGYFDEMDETAQEFDIEVPASDELEDVKNLIVYEVPEALAKDKYDLEASLRYPDGTIVSGMRVIANDIIQVS